MVLRGGNVPQRWVRVKVDGTWRSGTAVLMPEDDTRQRSRTLPYRWDAAVGRALATTPLTVRIDLDPNTRGLTRQYP